MEQKKEQIQQQTIATDIMGVLLDMRGGRVVADINAKFNDLVMAVLESAAKGSMQINITIDPTKFGFGGGVEEVNLAHEIKLKKPERKIGSSTFFVADGKLTREHPDQTSIFDDESHRAAADGKTEAGGQ